MPVPMREIIDDFFTRDLLLDNIFNLIKTQKIPLYQISNPRILTQLIYWPEFNL